MAEHRIEQMPVLGAGERLVGVDHPPRRRDIVSRRPASVSRDQIVTLAVLGGMIVLFLWDRLRYDLVALLALLAAVLGGVVHADHAFSGFSNPVVPLIAGALILSAAIARSGAVELLVRWLTPLLRSSSLQVGVLAACVASLSAFVKNVGALAIFMPVAFQVARRNDRSPSEFLMPLSFASLLGGSMTLIGTSPNMLTATVRQELEGAPFRMFDFFPVALGTALCGVVFLSFGWRLIPRGRRSTSADTTFKIEDYTSELKVGSGSPFAGRTIAELEDEAGGDLAVVAIVRDEYRRYVPGGSWAVLPNDLLVVEADPQALEQFIADGKLDVVGSKELPEVPEGTEVQGAEAKHDAALVPAELDPNRLATVEAVVTADFGADRPLRRGPPFTRAIRCQRPGDRPAWAADRGPAAPPQIPARRRDRLPVSSRNHL